MFRTNDDDDDVEMDDASSRGGTTGIFVATQQVRHHRPGGASPVKASAAFVGLFKSRDDDSDSDDEDNDMGVRGSDSKRKTGTGGFSQRMNLPSFGGRGGNFISSQGQLPRIDDNASAQNAPPPQSLMNGNGRDLKVALYSGNQRIVKQIEGARKQVTMTQAQIVANVIAEKDIAEQRLAVPPERQLFPFSEESQDGDIFKIVPGDPLMMLVKNRLPPVYNPHQPQIDVTAVVNGASAHAVWQFIGIAETINQPGDGFKTAASVAQLLGMNTVVHTGATEIPVMGTVGVSMVPFTIPVSGDGKLTRYIPGVIHKGTHPMSARPAFFHMKHTDIHEACVKITDYCAQKIETKISTMLNNNHLRSLLAHAEQIMGDFFQPHHFGNEIQPLHGWMFWHIVQLLVSPYAIRLWLSNSVQDSDFETFGTWIAAYWDQQENTMARVNADSDGNQKVARKQQLEQIATLRNGKAIGIVKFLQFVFNLATRQKSLYQEAQQAYNNNRAAGFTTTGARNAGQAMDIFVGHIFSNQ